MKITFVLPVLTQGGGNRVAVISAAGFQAASGDLNGVSPRHKTPSLPRQIPTGQRGVFKPDPNIEGVSRQIPPRIC
jgi:hypothetical protein